MEEHMFKAGDKVQINTTQGTRMQDAIVLDWTPYGVRFTYHNLIHFMPWSSIWSVTKPAQEAQPHDETV